MPDVNAINQAAEFLRKNRRKSVAFRDETRFSILGYTCPSKTTRRVIELLDLIPIEGYKLKMNLVPGSTAYIFKEDFEEYNNTDKMHTTISNLEMNLGRSD